MNENNVREKVIEGHKFGGLMLVLTILMYVVSVPGLMISIAGTSTRFRAIVGILALFFLLQAAMTNIGGSTGGSPSTYYADNCYYGGLTYRYVIGIEGGATFKPRDSNGANSSIRLI